jgi:long-chain acyl-CoA synthetase
MFRGVHRIRPQANARATWLPQFASDAMIRQLRKSRTRIAQNSMIAKTQRQGDTPMETRPWHKNYPQGMPHETPVESGLTLPAMIARSCETYPSRIAYSCLGAGLTYAEFDRYSRAFGAWLQGLGLQQGDRVALMLPNSIVHPIAMAGVLRAGLIVVSVNPLYTARELEHQLNDSGARVIVTGGSILPTVRQASAPALQHIVCASLAELQPSGAQWTPDANAAPLEGAFTFAQTLALPPSALIAPEIDPEDAAFLQYTGGTTGVSKGAALSHRNLLAALATQFAWLGSAFRFDGTHCVTPLPLYHIYPLNIALMLLACGGTNRLVPNPRETSQIVDEFKRGPFHVFTGINTLLNGLVASGGLDRADFAAARLVIGAGSPVQQAVAERWHAETGTYIRQGYGLTECAPVVTYNRIDEPGMGSGIGLPVPSTDVKLIDADGKDIAAGERGKLCVRGPQVFSGYWQRPADTAKSFTPDGWFRTGDIAIMDAGGFFQLVDRVNDMILVSGFNVYPNEIEDVIAMLPQVLECACVGMPDQRSGEVPQVFIVKRDPALSAAEVEAFCRKNLTAYKVPKRINFVDSLPKSPVGKILRRELRTAFAEKAGAA